MKKMMRTAAVLAAMVLALVLSACSNSAGDDRGNGGASGGGIGGGSDTGSDNALTVSYAADLVGTWKVTGDTAFVEVPDKSSNVNSTDPSAVIKALGELYSMQTSNGYAIHMFTHQFDFWNCVTFSTEDEAKEFIQNVNLMVDFCSSDIEEFANIFTRGDESDLTKYIVANADYESEGHCVINGSKDKIQGRFYFTLYCEAPEELKQEMQKDLEPLSAKVDVKITLEKQSTEK